MDHPQILAYVEPLIPVSHIRHENGSVEAIPDKNSGLFEVKRLYCPDHSRFGMVIRLTDIWRPVGVIPMFGDNCPPDWTSDSAVEEARTFVVNIYHSKDSFQCLSS